MCRSDQRVWRWKFSIPVIALVIVLSMALVACGNAGRTSVGSAGPTPTPHPTTQANTTGCPNNTAVTTQPPAAAVVLKNADNNTTVSVKQGATVEVDLPYGNLWSGPTGTSANLLTLQSPSGYAVPSSQMCVWRFVASSSGTANLTFVGRPICQAGKACPMYVVSLSFVLEISQ